MLYDLWRKVATERAAETALTDMVTGRRWTFRQLADAAEQGRANGERLVFPEGSSAEFVIGVLRAWRLGQAVCPLEAGQSIRALPKPLPAGIAHLKTTSATTGNARLVAFAEGGLAADAENIVNTMGLRPDWPNLGVISLAHSYGFSNLLLPLVLHGIPLVLAGAALPETVRAAASAGPALTLPAVPALWRTWYDADAIPANVRLAISAGAPLPVLLEQMVYERQGLKIHNFYGSSECGGIAYDSSSQPRQDGSRVGVPLKNVRVSIAEDGCVEVRSAAVAQGYWPEPEPNLGGGLFHTSDLGAIEGGQVLLLGRATDQINVAGRKVAPEVIERALASHPQVRSCLAFGVPNPNPQRGETIVACIAASQELSTEILKQHALALLPAWQVPREWWLVDSLAGNSRGKLSRSEWRTRYLAREKHNLTD